MLIAPERPNLLDTATELDFSLKRCCPRLVPLRLVVEVEACPVYGGRMLQTGFLPIELPHNARPIGLGHLFLLTFCIFSILILQPGTYEMSYLAVSNLRLQTLFAATRSCLLAPDIYSSPRWPSTLHLRS